MYSVGGKLNNDKFISSLYDGYKFFGYGSQMEYAGYGKDIITCAYGTFPRKYWYQKRKVLSPFVRRIALGTVAVTVAADKLTATASMPALPVFYTGSLIYATGLNIPIPDLGYTMNAGQIMRIKEVNTTTGVVTFDRLIDSLTSGNYAITVEVLAPVGGITIGNLSGNTATQVVSEGNSSNALTSPVWVLANGFANNIVSGTSSTITFSNNITYPQDRAVMSHYEYEESGESFAHPLTNGFCNNGTAFTKGALYTNSDSYTAPNVVGWLCTRSGVKGSSIPPEFKTIYVTENNNTSTTLNANGSVAVAQDELVSYIVVKCANAATGFEIGTTAGGGEIEPGVNISAGSSKTWNTGLYFSTAGTLYFTNVPAATEIIVKKA